MHLGWEVPVQRADRDVGAFGNGTHLNRLISTLRGDSQCGIEDALATLSLSLRTEFGLGQGGHRQHLRLTWVARRAGTGFRWRRHAVSGSFCFVVLVKTIRTRAPDLSPPHRPGLRVSCCNAYRFDHRPTYY